MDTSHVSMRTFCRNLFYFLVPVITGFLPAYANCPVNSLPEAVRHCLAEYDAYSRSIGHPTTLMYGTDVEVIRVLCTRYKHSMLCVDFMKAECRNNRAAIREIDRLTVNVLYLTDVCTKSDFYERYAMNQHCFKSVHKQSARCYQQFVKQTERSLPEALAGIKLAAKFTCIYYDSLSSCIKTEIERSGCGIRATALVDDLIRPAVRVGRVCKEIKMVAPTSTPRPTRAPRSRGHRPYSPRKKDSYKMDRSSAVGAGRTSIQLIVCSLFSIVLLLYH